MQDKSDAQLLRDYAEHGTESAFRELVARYTDLVYSAALRQVESSDLAADIAQNIFVDLARKARPISERLTGHKSLAGWLHRSTRFLALNHLRDSHRRVTNERQAMEQLLTNTESTPDWERIRPALDEALDSLADEDREALLLRYFKNHDFRAVGLALGTSDDAAQKRVSRAIERLREFFAKRGVTVGTSGLAVVISANAVKAAPIGLALTISTAAALTGTTLTATATITATKAIAMTALQKTIVTATIAVLAGAGIYEARQASQLGQQVQSLQQQQAPLTEQNQKLQLAHEDVTSQLAALRAENDRLNRNTAELLKLRGEVGLLRQGQVELAKLREENQTIRNALAALPTPTTTSTNVTPLFMREYNINVEEFLGNLNYQVKAVDGEGALDKLRRFFEQNGVACDPPASLFINDKKGILWARNSLTNLDSIEMIIRLLNTAK